MKASWDKYKWKNIVRWVLFSVTGVYIISGLGITRYQIMEKITFGLLTKILAFKIHRVLLIPFLLLLLAHILLAVRIRKRN